MAYLGRPWRPYGSVAFIDCEIGDHIQPAGWDNWGNVENEKTARYAEYGTKTLSGEKTDLSTRAPWAKRLTAAEAERYRNVVNVLGGWNPDALVGAAWQEQATASRKSSVIMNLWPGDPPNKVQGSGPGADDGTGRYRNVGIPGMLVYLPQSSAKSAKRIAIIACPGGGYSHLTRLEGADGAVAAFNPRDVVVVSLK
jgi:hypothetical protein